MPDPTHPYSSESLRKRAKKLRIPIEEYSLESGRLRKEDLHARIRDIERRRRDRLVIVLSTLVFVAILAAVAYMSWRAWRGR